MAQKKMTDAEVEEFFRRLAENDPEPETELTSTNDFTFTVAVILSAQATDKGVNKASPTLFAVADTAEKMVALGEEKLKDYIKSIGLYKTKAKNIIGMSQALIDHHNGEIPNDREALQALPGIGRKTANVVLNVLYGAPFIGVDTHVFRLSNRMGLAPGDTPPKVEAALEKRLPKKYCKYANHWLVLHGRYVCTAKKPKCADCLAKDLCKFNEKTA